MDRYLLGKSEFFNQEKRYIRKDGKIILGKITVSAIQKRRQTCSFCQQVGRHHCSKRQERAEKTKSDEIQVIIDGIGDLLFIMDKNRIITKVNKATCDAFKKKPEEIIGRYCYEIVHGTNSPWCNCPATKTFETKQTVTEEVNDPILRYTTIGDYFAYS